MGTKHPDRVGTEHWRSAAETALDMYRKNWDLVAHCRQCDLRLAVDLRVVILTRGPRFSLWNQHPRCRRIVYLGRCGGFMDFEFRAPGMSMHRALKASDRAPAAPLGHVMRAFYEEQQRQLDGDPKPP